MPSSSCTHSAVSILIIYLIDGLLSESITCANDWDASECREQTISCTNSSSTCSIHCDGEGSCGGSTLNCNENTNAQCSIYCTGEQSCRGAVSDSAVYCAANANCNIHCDGVHSCEDINIHCPSTSNCTIYANNQYAFINAQISCESGANGCSLTANCNDINACHDAIIDARNASTVAIHCANNKNACKNINIGCPRAKNGEKVCFMEGDEGTKHNDIRIYAVNSWDDIDLSAYVAQTTSGETLHSTMFCGEKFLDESCIISLASWNCADETSICYRNSSDIHPFPTRVPTIAPTRDDSDDDHITSWAVIIAIIVAIFMFCLFVILGYVWCWKQRQNMETKYDSLETKNDPDADIMQKESRHMYRTSVPRTKQTKSFDIETKGGLHIVNEYSDASKFGGLLPISEEKSKDFVVQKTANNNAVIEEEREGLISSNVKKQNVVGVDADNEDMNAQNNIKVNEQPNGSAM